MNGTRQLRPIFRRRLWLISLAIFLAGTAALSLGAALLQAVPAAAWEEKIDPPLRQILERDGAQSTEERVEFIISLRDEERAFLPPAGWSKTDKGAAVYAHLTARARSSQQPLLVDLDRRGVVYRPFWIVNAVWVSAPAGLLPELAARPEVAFIHANPRLPALEPLPLPPAELGPESRAAASSVTWGIDKINAPLLWSEGITGTGVVVAGQDTGYQWNHPALIDQYRGWDGITATHSFNWFDAIEADINGNGFNPCGYSSPVPCDDNGHGTHTMGTIAGSVDSSGTAIGVAPGAKWISCRNMEQGYGTLATYITCFEWFLAPTDLAGQNPDPALAPHVVNNSWTCPISEGCNSGNFALMGTAVDNLRAAGVVVVVSAGNSGSSCSTVNAPAGIFEGSFTVGATGSTDAIASFSSRGPVSVDGSGRLKPDVVAPGVGVRSAYVGGGYLSLQGTSMAGPHVAGAVALLISAVPAAAGQVDLLEQALRESAVPLTTSQSCGGDTPGSIPNHTYGYGRIDVAAARDRLEELIEHRLEVTKTAVEGVRVYGDLPATEPITYTLILTHAHPHSATSGVLLTDTVPAGTVFVTGTLPHLFDGGVISWTWPSLFNESRTVTLTVAASLDAETSFITVTNEIFGAQSVDVAPVSGQPVQTGIFRFAQQQLLPFVVSDENGD